MRREKGGISLAPIKAVLTEQPLFPKSVNDTNRQERETRRMDSAERTLSILQPVNGSFRSSITFFFMNFVLEQRSRDLSNWQVNRKSEDNGMYL